MYDREKCKRKMDPVPTVRTKLEYFKACSNTAWLIHVSQVPTAQNSLWKRICENRKLREENNTLRSLVWGMSIVITMLITILALI